MATDLKADLATRGLVSANGACEYGNVAIAAKVLGVSASFLNKARVSGDGPPFLKFGAAVRYHIPTLLAWAASQTRRSTSDQGEAA